MYYVYIATNWNNKVVYIGMTSDLCKRMHEHREKIADGFTKKYNIDKLVYYESGEDFDGVLEREKEIKGWRRDKKECLIFSMNPKFKDLYLDLCE